MKKIIELVIRKIINASHLRKNKKYVYFSHFCNVTCRIELIIDLLRNIKVIR